jgi:hypothetical protein
MRISIQQQNKLLHIIVEDEECFMYSLEIIEDLDTKQIFIKSGGELINSLYEEDLDKLTISDFMFNECLYTLYKKFINVLNQLKIPKI